MDNKKIEFGKRLAEIRKSKKIKQNELMEMIDAPSVQMISSWETGKSFPSAIYLINLAKSLDISLDYLFFGENNVEKDYKILTYKKAAIYIIELQNCGLFNSIKSNISDIDTVFLSSDDNTLKNFIKEYNLLLCASKSLRKELYNQAISDLLNKYDIEINNK